jgi:hypothetical protein
MNEPVCLHGPMVRRAGFSRNLCPPFASWHCPATPGICAPVQADVNILIESALIAWLGATA